MKATKRNLLILSAALSVLMVFTQAAWAYTVTILDPPGGDSSYGAGMNDLGDVAGWYYNSSGYARAYTYSTGTYPNLPVPGSTWATANGVNDTGDIAGHYRTSRFGDDHAYVYDASTNNFTDLTPFGYTRSQAHDINDNGYVTGNYYATKWNAYLFDGSSYSMINAPDSSFTFAYGMNDSGDVVGRYVDGSNGTHGYLFDGSSYTTIDVPGATRTYAYDINNNGDVVGYYYVSATGRNYGFLYDASQDAYLTNPIGDYNDIFYFAINDTGQIAGYYNDVDRAYGFLATPAAIPEPTSLLLLGSGLAGLMALKRKRRE